MTQNSAHTGKLYGRHTHRQLGRPVPARWRGVCRRRCHLLRRHACDVKAANAPGYLQAACPLRRECDRQPRCRPGRPSAGGETLAFASDAGMPSVSDPGQALVEAAREADVPVEVIPGPSACVTALVSSGIPCEQFFFEGFWAASTVTACAVCSALPWCPARSSSTSLHIASWRRSGCGRGLSPA